MLSTPMLIVILESQEIAAGWVHEPYGPTLRWTEPRTPDSHMALL